MSEESFEYDVGPRYQAFAAVGESEYVPPEGRPVAFDVRKDNVDSVSDNREGIAAPLKCFA